jgi:hypothetical protein
MTLSKKVNLMIKPIHKNHFDTTFTQYNAYLNLYDLVRNFQIKVEFI